MKKLKDIFEERFKLTVSCEDVPVSPAGNLREEVDAAIARHAASQDDVIKRFIIVVVYTGPGSIVKSAISARLSAMKW